MSTASSIPKGINRPVSKIKSVYAQQIKKRVEPISNKDIIPNEALSEHLKQSSTSMMVLDQPETLNDEYKQDNESDEEEELEDEDLYRRKTCKDYSSIINRLSFSSSSFSSTSNSYNHLCTISKPVNLFKSKHLDEASDEDDSNENEEDLHFMSLSGAINDLTKNNETISFLSQSQISMNSSAHPHAHHLINNNNNNNNNKSASYQRGQLLLTEQAASLNHDQFMDSVEEDL